MIVLTVNSNSNNFITDIVSTAKNTSFTSALELFNTSFLILKDSNLNPGNCTLKNIAHPVITYFSDPLNISDTEWDYMMFNCEDIIKSQPTEITQGTFDAYSSKE